MSDHGFGHIARNFSVIVSLIERYDVLVYAVCGEKHIDFAKQYLSSVLTAEQYGRVIFRTGKMDIGLILLEGTLLVDRERLANACEKYLDGIPLKAEKERLWLLDNKIDCALCDMPLWSIKACETAKVPILYVGNFTWTELYREFLPEHIWKEYAKYYRSVKHVMLYEFHDDEMLEFLDKSDISEVGMTARRFDGKAVEMIKSGHTRKIIFAALGMSAQFKKPVDVSMEPYDFYTTEGVPLEGDNVTVIPYTTPNTQDYVAASDYVISKAGWGTVAECLFARKPMALFRRDSILEDRTTIKLLEQKHLAVSVTQQDLQDIKGIVRKLDRLDGSYDGFYDCADEIADKLMTL